MKVVDTRVDIKEISVKALSKLNNILPIAS